MVGPFWDDYPQSISMIPGFGRSEVVVMCPDRMVNFPIVELWPCTSSKSVSHTIYGLRISIKTNGFRASVE